MASTYKCSCETSCEDSELPIQARQTRPNSGGLQRAIQDSTKGGLQ